MISILLPGEESSILAEAYDSGPRDHLMINLALHTGLRNTELIMLDCKDVYFYDTNLKYIELSKVSTKNKNPRTLPLHPSLQIEIKNFLIWKSLNSEIITPESPLFVSKNTHRRLSPRDFQRILHIISIKAIRRSIHPHILRHTFATKLLKKTNIRVVQELLGHSSLNSTQIYTHVTIDDLKTAIDQL